MRPFLSVSLPEVPSYSEFASRVSLHSESIVGDPPHQWVSGRKENIDQASLILDFADQALRIARKNWEAISKANADTARCIGCDDWWRGSVKNVVRACITANIMVATSKKALSSAASTDVRNILKLEVVKSHEHYHAWWLVPRISVR